MKVILDNGHGRDTAGKRSPDGRLREYAYTREMARRIAQDLKRQGIDVSLLVPEDTDVPLKERVERATEFMRKLASRLYSYRYMSMPPVTVLHGFRPEGGACSSIRRHRKTASGLRRP